MPEGLRVMDAAARKFGIDLHFDHFDFSSWDYCEKHGQMLPDNWKDQIGGHDALYFGAVGWPDKIADHVSLWGSLLLFRREFDQYINLRPARLMPGIIAPVVRKDGSRREPGEIDMYIVRENTEGEYSAIGGRMFPGTERELVVQESVFTRHGSEIAARLVTPPHPEFLKECRRPRIEPLDLDVVLMQVFKRLSRKRPGIIDKNAEFFEVLLSGCRAQVVWKQAIEPTDPGRGLANTHHFPGSGRHIPLQSSVR